MIPKFDTSAILRMADVVPKIDPSALQALTEAMIPKFDTSAILRMAEVLPKIDLSDYRILGESMIPKIDFDWLQSVVDNLPTESDSDSAPPGGEIATSDLIDTEVVETSAAFGQIAILLYYILPILGLAANRTGIRMADVLRLVTELQSRNPELGPDQSLSGFLGSIALIIQLVATLRQTYVDGEQAYLNNKDQSG